ncbi:hypothetical protein V6Z12_1Z015500 [Gossypium hirsutum]
MYCPITGLIHSGCITDERPISIPFKKFRLAPLNSLDCDLACFYPSNTRAISSLSLPRSRSSRFLFLFHPSASSCFTFRALFLFRFSYRFLAPFQSTVLAIKTDLCSSNAVSRDQ